MENYGTCNFCGANRIKSPKTGKIYCQEKCWLNNPAPNTSPNAQSSPSGVQTVDKEAILMDEIAALRAEINKRFDNLGIFLKNKLG